MENVIKNVCGLDIHKSSITACIMDNVKEEIRTFGTTTEKLLNLKEWLNENRVSHLAMESTGIYWKPIYNILQKDQDINLILVNASHIKYVPGRKTDVNDSQWLCKLLKAGLLKGSFIPPEKIRNLRDLTRFEDKLQHQLTAHKNRIHKLLHECNIKISDILTDIFGLTGFKILKDLSEGINDSKKLSNYFIKKKRKHELAQEALKGNVNEHYQFMLKSLLAQIDFTKKSIDEINEKLEKIIGEEYFEEQQLLLTIPGINKKSTYKIIAELGVDMKIFPSQEHASSWVGICPITEESGGKKKAGYKEGNKHLKSVLTQCSWAAIKTDESYLKGKYYSSVIKLGPKKALNLISHKLLKASYQVLSKKEVYKEEMECVF